MVGEYNKSTQTTRSSAMFGRRDLTLIASYQGTLYKKVISSLALQILVLVHAVVDL